MCTVLYHCHWVSTQLQLTNMSYITYCCQSLMTCGFFFGTYCKKILRCKNYTKICPLWEPSRSVRTDVPQPTVAFYSFTNVLKNWIFKQFKLSFSYLFVSRCCVITVHLLSKVDLMFVENYLWNFHMPKWNIRDICDVGFFSGSSELHVLTWLCSRELLDETGEVTLTSSWKEIKKLVKDDPRYSKFSSSDRVM
jgi:hypothetical protein